LANADETKDRLSANGLGSEHTNDVIFPLDFEKLEKPEGGAADMKAMRRSR
jgi:hypothetical protein